MIKGIVCCAEDWGIGKKNGLLFNVPADMKFFRETTKKQIVVMGYATYLSLPEKYRPLPNRTSFVLWDKATSFDCLKDCVAFNDFNQLLTFVKVLAKDHDVYICGGASVYRLFLPYYDLVYVTKVHAVDPEATAFFPNLDENPDFAKDGRPVVTESNGYTIAFETYKKIVKPEMEKTL